MQTCSIWVFKTNFIYIPLALPDTSAISLLQTSSFLVATSVYCWSKLSADIYYRRYCRQIYNKVMDGKASLEPYFNRVIILKQSLPNPTVPIIFVIFPRFAQTYPLSSSPHIGLYIAPIRLSTWVCIFLFQYVHHLTRFCYHFFIQVLICGQKLFFGILMLCH